MKITDYLRVIKNPLRKRTITFLLRNNEVLLGFKKRGFGKGNFLGIGGKVEQNETIEQAAKREVREEINIELINLEQVGLLKFYFPHILDESWNQEVHVFISNSWKGEPQESEEIKPEWFSINKIPYEKMWDDAKYYLPLIIMLRPKNCVLRGKPKILGGEKLEASFIFDEKLKVVDKKIHAV